VSEDDEAGRVVERYARRDAHDDRYALWRPDVLRAVQERQRAIVRALTAAGCTEFSDLRLLEVGCGGGGNLLELLRLGFRAEHLAGVELLPERLAQARTQLPAALALHGGDALTLDLSPASQDLVLQFPVFSSLLDDAFQQRLADAMWCWVKPGGAVLWYDFTVDNPRNPDVRGVPLRRVRELFPEGRIDARRVTLAPPIARRVVRIHPSFYTAFNALPLLRTHLLCWIAKP